MVSPWTNWKRLPDPILGESIEAPGGPGLYEVRRTSNGELAAFGPAANVAQAMAALRLHAQPISWLSIVRSRQARDDYEYRTRATATKEEAKRVADSLRGRRNVYWRSRTGWRAAGGNAA
jgi:hypothetical protein